MRAQKKHKSDGEAKSSLYYGFHRQIKRDLTEDMKANFHEHPIILFLFLIQGMVLCATVIAEYI